MEVFWRNKDELLKLKDELDKSIDQFVEYIDDGKQYERALRWNEILINRMEFIDDLIKEFTFSDWNKLSLSPLRKISLKVITMKLLSLSNKISF